MNGTGFPKFPGQNNPKILSPFLVIMFIKRLKPQEARPCEWDRFSKVNNTLESNITFTPFFIQDIWNGGR